MFAELRVIYDLRLFLLGGLRRVLRCGLLFGVVVLLSWAVTRGRYLIFVAGHSWLSPVLGCEPVTAALKPLQAVFPGRDAKRGVLGGRGDRSYVFLALAGLSTSVRALFFGLQSQQIGKQGRVFATYVDVLHTIYLSQVRHRPPTLSVIRGHDGVDEPEPLERAREEPRIIVKDELGGAKSGYARSTRIGQVWRNSQLLSGGLGPERLELGGRSLSRFSHRPSY